MHPVYPILSMSLPQYLSELLLIQFHRTGKCAWRRVLSAFSIHELMDDHKCLVSLWFARGCHLYHQELYWMPKLKLELARYQTCNLKTTERRLYQFVTREGLLICLLERDLLFYSQYYIHWPPHKASKEQINVLNEEFIKVRQDYNKKDACPLHLYSCAFGFKKFTLMRHNITSERSKTLILWTKIETKILVQWQFMLAVGLQIRNHGIDDSLSEEKNVSLRRVESL